MHAWHRTRAPFDSISPLKHILPLGLCFQFFFSFLCIFSLFLQGQDTIALEFSILSFQASWTLILHLTDLNFGLRLLNLFLPSLFQTLRYINTLGGKLVSVSFIFQGSQKVERDWVQSTKLEVSSYSNSQSLFSCFQAVSSLPSMFQVFHGAPVTNDTASGSQCLVVFLMGTFPL